jgi:hypothetical protein
MLGIAFQLTNILRDVREDFEMGRVYLPQEDLARFGCAEQSLGEPVASPEFVRMMKFEVDRAWRFYEEGVRLQDMIGRDSQAALWTLTRIYSGVLRKVETIDYDVLAKPRPGLSRIEKAWIMLRAGAGLWKPGLCPRRTGCVRGSRRFGVAGQADRESAAARGPRHHISSARRGIHRQLPACDAALLHESAVIRTSFTPSGSIVIGIPRSSCRPRKSAFSHAVFNIRVD